MPFPLGAWIDAHVDCRYNLGSSGMVGSIRRPALGRPRPGELDPATLRDVVADHLRVDAPRVFLTHGATEANSWVVLYLRTRARVRAPVGRVRYPEYPPLVDTARCAGYRIATDGRPALVAIVSRPRNPEGDLWSPARLAQWRAGARNLLVDETFREFAGVATVARRGDPGVWATGSLTKFYGGDDLRVGWVVAPPDAADEFGRFHGNVADEVAGTSVHGAVAALRAHREIARSVARVLDPNRAAWRRAFPGRPVPVGPVGFDRTAEDGDALAARCLRASVLVCSGRFFGAPNGVRVGLTRRSFPTDVDRYLAVRDARGPTGPRPRTGARPRRAETARARAVRA